MRHFKRHKNYTEQGINKQNIDYLYVIGYKVSDIKIRNINLKTKKLGAKEYKQVQIINKVLKTYKL